MTALAQDIQALLSALPGLSGGAWHVINDAQPPVYPYLVWSRIASPANVSLSGPSGMQNTRIQVDIFSRSVSQLDGLSKALDAAMASWSVQNVPLGGMDSYEDMVRAYRATREFSIWASN